MPCTFNFLLLIQKNNSKKKQKNKTYVLNKSRLMEQALIFDIYCNWGGGGVWRFGGVLHMMAYTRLLMGVPNSQLTTNFSAKYQLTTIFWQFVTFSFLRWTLFRHSPNFLKSRNKFTWIYINSATGTIF